MICIFIQFFLYLDRFETALVTSIQTLYFAHRRRGALERKYLNAGEIKVEGHEKTAVGREATQKAAGHFGIQNGIAGRHRQIDPLDLTESARLVSIRVLAEP